VDITRRIREKNYTEHRDMPFEVIDHTADTGIRVWAQDLAELIPEAARGMFAQITDPEAVAVTTVETISADGIDETDLVINVLRELLFLFTGGNLLLRWFAVDSVNGRTVTGRAGCEPFDPEKHPVRGDIKAVTYAGGDLVVLPDGLEITIIFDI